MICGVVLAAGAGTRFGGPKALALDDAGVPWLARAVEALRAGGCHDVVVVLGAGADAALPLVPESARAVLAEDWALGLSRSLIAGLAAAAPADAAVVVPVDTPELPAAAVARVIASLGPTPRASLAQAVFGGRPGHPVAIGRDHIPVLTAGLVGDRGARSYLAAHGVTEVECGDLWCGEDRDRA